MAEEEEARVECPYPDCDKDYSTQSYLDNHIADKHADDELPEEVPAEEPVPDEEPVTSSEDPLEGKSCDNHPDRDAVGRTDGVKASVVHYCIKCKERYT